MCHALRRTPRLATIGRSSARRLAGLLAWLALIATVVEAREFTVKVGEHQAIHAIVSGSVSLPPPAEIERWVQRAGDALGAYAGGLARDDLYVTVSVEPGAGIYGGQALPSDPPLVSIRIGQATTRAQFDRDWVLTHELAHTFVPDLPATHRWFEEGFAGYVEAMARARAGQRGVSETWRYLHSGIRNGRPGALEQGLDGARGWGRVYWASVEFFLRADIALRRRSHGAVGMPEVVAAWRARGIAMGGSAGLEELLRVAGSTGAGDVLGELYRRVGVDGAPWRPDENWRALGLVDARGRFTAAPAAQGLHSQFLPAR